MAGERTCQALRHHATATPTGGGPWAALLRNGGALLADDGLLAQLLGAQLGPHLRLAGLERLDVDLVARLDLGLKGIDRLEDHLPPFLPGVGRPLGTDI